MNPPVLHWEEFMTVINLLLLDSFSSALQLTLISLLWENLAARTGDVTRTFIARTYLFLQFSSVGGHTSGCTLLLCYSWKRCGRSNWICVYWSFLLLQPQHGFILPTHLGLVLHGSGFLPHRQAEETQGTWCSLFTWTSVGQWETAALFF